MTYKKKVTPVAEAYALLVVGLTLEDSVVAVVAAVAQLVAKVGAGFVAAVVVLELNVDALVALLEIPLLLIVPNETVASP